MREIQYRGAGYAKLILFGEHAAVYGYPAVGVALTDRTEVIITPGDGTAWTAPDLAPIFQPYLNDLMTALETELPAVWPAADIRALRGRIAVESTVPVAQGFGSSASLCVALAEAALKTVAAGDAVPERLSWRLANRLERLFHGKPSGIDTGLALHAGMTAFSFGSDELPDATRLDGASFSLVAGAVPRTANTRQQIAAIAQRVSGDDRRTVDLLAELGAIAAAAVKMLPRVADAGTIRELGKMADRAHAALAELGLNTPQLAECLAVCGECGAAGGKLSGAGGGGAFYALFTEEASAHHAAATLLERGVLDAASLRVVTVRDGRCRAPEPTPPLGGNRPDRNTTDGYPVRG